MFPASSRSKRVVLILRPMLGHGSASEPRVPGKNLLFQEILRQPARWLRAGILPVLTRRQVHLIRLVQLLVMFLQVPAEAVLTLTLFWTRRLLFQQMQKCLPC